MRFIQTFICMGFVVGVFSAPASLEAQSSSVYGPVLGFTPDREGAIIWPVLGVPGASILGDRLEFEADIRNAVISPKQDYAIAIRAEDAAVIVIDFADTRHLIPVAGAHPGANMIAFSPMGSVAAVYADESRMVQIIGGLPQSPAVIREFDVSIIPGRAASMAVSDDGAVALVNFVDDERAALWMMDSSGALSEMSSGVSAIAFFPNRHDVVVADDVTQSAILLMDVRQTATRIPLMAAVDGVAGFSSVSTSEDGRRVFLGNTTSDSITIVDMETGLPVVVSCYCAPTGFYRLKGTSIFRLAEPSSEPVMVLDASSQEPRIAVIPSRASAVLEAQ